MYKRDLITAEIQQLVKAIAQLMGLKVEGKDEEARQFFESILDDEFGLKIDELIEFKEEEFRAWLKSRNYKADQLELFARFLYTRIEDFSDDDSEGKSIAKKLLMLYRFIEEEHHLSSFENISREQRVKKFVAGGDY